MKAQYRARIGFVLFGSWWWWAIAVHVDAADVVDFGSRTPSADEFEAALRPAPARDDGIMTRGLRPVEDLKTLSMELQFEYDSARLSESSQRLLKNLGAAIERPGLKDYRFRIEGHTDSKGSAPYNQHLSERRADSVRSFLLGNFGIPAKRLEAIGRGEESPREGRAPEDPANRRVEIVTLEDGK